MPKLALVKLIFIDIKIISYANLQLRHPEPRPASDPTEISGFLLLRKTSKNIDESAFLPQNIGSYFTAGK